LAKELKNEYLADANYNLYNLSGLTGTIQYMAPEVYKKQPYNQSVDVYSFALCLWEMFSFCKPFQGYNKELFESLAIKRQCRPPVGNKWPLFIKLLLNRSWSTNVSERPSAQMAAEILENELIALRSGKTTGEHMSSHVSFIKEVSMPVKSLELMPNTYKVSNISPLHTSATNCMA